jgi:cytochrome P450
MDAAAATALRATTLIPPRIVPPARPLGRLAFVATFVRNPLEVVPQGAYEQDFYAGTGMGRVWITEGSLIKTVLLDEPEKFRKLVAIRLLAPLLGKGILTSEGADWKWQRQACAPMFRYHDLVSFVPQYVRATQTLLARWRAAPQGSVQPIERDMARVTFDVISATLLPSADRTIAPVIEESMRGFQRSSGWSQLFASAGAPSWLPRPGMSSGARAITALRSAVAAIVRERRASGGGPDDLMNRLMRARDPETGQQMNDRQLVDNLLTFYLAGHETTARALGWTLYLLARSPGWAAALEEEIAQVTGGAQVTPAHIERLVLVQQVLKESMRLYPPVPVISRQAVVDARLGDHHVKAGTSVVIPIYVIHRHVKRWEDPDRFDPGRFAPEKEAKLPRYQYLPFGAGPRICIGSAFAMIESTAILATLLQHARFAAVAGREPYPVARVTLHPRGGIPLAVSLR